MVNTGPNTSLDGKIVYPAILRTDVKDTVHGITVEDPYRWLEDPDSEATGAFVTAQNEVTKEFLNNFAARDKYNARLTELFNYERYSAPYKRGNYYYFFHNSGLQAQNILYQQDSIEGERRVFLDPNTLEEDGTAALSTHRFSKSGKIYGYAIAKSGSDWVTIYLKDDKGNALEDVIEWAKFTDISFTHDDKGFFYSSYEKPNIDKEKAGTETGTNINKRLYYHKIGTPQAEDVLVYLDTSNPTHSPSAEVSDDGKYILLTVGKDCDPVNKLFIVDLEATGNVISRDWPINKVVDNFDALYSYLTNDGTVFYFQTNKDAPRYKVVKYDLSKPEQGFTEIVPQVEDVLSSAVVVNKDKLVLQYMHDVKSCLYIHDLSTGRLLNQITVPIGTISGISGRKEDDEFFFSFTSYLTPGTIYRYNFESLDEEKRLSIFRQADVKNFDNSLFETNQVFYESKDGTKIPMFITHKKGLVLNSNNPAFLYGYGGFSIPIEASYSPSAIVFMQHLDGVVAFANLRGGGEYGEDWHKAGMLLNKQNVFDDFQYAAKYLIREKYTQPSRLAINGGSNGGLLVGACVNQAPELFGAAVADVGVLDMLRFHKFTIGHAWQSDYGYPDDNKEDFLNLHKYSPLHNINTDKPYPPLALFTSSHDDRVVPLHSFKYIAELQHKAGPLTSNPLVIRVETKAGHGAGKPISKRIAETTDKFSFIASSIGAEWRD
ncbi:hypothetical protein BGW38_003802 [Lunasporangiospora selenospora]|uniref:Prolyl endopeptidase n=1 Tax=Lunasporangiospora selenospora TaxID=979761 RepID=A0A9P6FQZ0_9FUNG|nr:hypothetical protein BGW38_003802 [Lunasporangiospora selenospora]